MWPVAAIGPRAERCLFRGNEDGRMLWLLGWLFLVGAVPIAVLYRRERKQARARVRGSQIADSAMGMMEFAVVGDGPALLVSHGIGGGFDQALELVDSFARRGFRVVAPSRFGYLRSELPDDASPEAQADAFAFLLRSLGIERVVALGVSAGAPSTLQFAIRHPELCAAVVLIAPGACVSGRGTSPPPWGRDTRLALAAALRFDFLFWLGLRLAPEAMVRNVLGTQPALLDAAPPEERDRALNVLWRMMPIGARARGIARDRAALAALERYPLDRVAAPLIAIGCEDDLFAACEVARYAAAQVARGRLVSFPTGGHFWIGHDDDLWNAVGAFLRPIAGSG
jgi:pimeloyl-ACP methyl ester carboxylesterase